MEVYSLHLPNTYNSTYRQRLGSSRTRKLGKKILKKTKKLGKKLFFCLRTRGEETRSRETVVMPAKRAKGSVGEGEAGKKAKATQHAGGQSVSEKSQATRSL